MKHLTISVTVAVLSLAAPLHRASGALGKSTVGTSARVVRLVLRDGASRIVRLEGVGCDETICSRVAIGTRTIGNVSVNRTQFGEIAAVQDICDDEAVFVFKNGARRHMSIVRDNRVLYVIDADGRPQKINLGRLVSIDFDVQASR